MSEYINDNSQNNAAKPSQKVGMQHDSAFSGNVFFTLAKRAERLVTALYMVSNFVTKDRSLQEDMRRHGLRVIKNLYKCLSCDVYDQQFFLEEALVHGEYILTVLSIAGATGMVSDMNKNILEKAVVDLTHQIDRQLKITLQYEQTFSRNNTQGMSKETLLGFLQDTVDPDMLGEEFQETLQNALAHKTTSKTTQNDIVTKRQNTPVSIKKTSAGGSAAERQKKIQDIIKEKGDATIKDIATRITNCSEKTLQRDLIKLIKDNIVEKEGDKRWSIYRIKDNT